MGANKAQYRTDFTYDIENKPLQLTYGNANNKTAYVYDGIGRVSTRTVTVGGGAYTTSYSYLAGSHNGSTTTPLISGITQAGENFTYTYDNVGNILTVTQNGKHTAYTYDAVGQLIRVDDENDTTSGSTGTTWTYEYDRGGNILFRRQYDYTTGTLGTVIQTTTYTYDSNWKDRLYAFNGNIIQYDGIGNPTFYAGWTYEWEKGRQLKKMVRGDGAVLEFAYNSEGLRVRKKVTYPAGSVETANYTWHGKNIVHMTRGNYAFHFWYDAQNRPAVVEWNNGFTTAKYAYVHNLQGDIVGIVDSSGNEVVKYTYNAWGKVLSTTGSLASSLGIVQPFRYRGYVYDTETGLYYLRSRYYNPNWQRFVNADIFISNASFSSRNNLYQYCINCPITYCDKEGSEEERLVNPGYDFPFYNEPLMEEHKIFVATICGEAIGESRESWIAVAWVIVNRVGHREWRKYDNVTDIIIHTGFDGYNSRQYNECMKYLENRDGSNKLYEEVISAVMPVYFYEMDDVTSYSTMF